MLPSFHMLLVLVWLPKVLFYHIVSEYFMSLFLTVRGINEN